MNMNSNAINLSSKVNFAIISFLARKSKKLYGREIAAGTKLSVGAVNQSLNLLSKKGFLIREDIAGASFYRVDDKNPAVRQFKIFLNVSETIPLLEKIKGECSKIILFGSCAEGSDEEWSDVDLLIITQNPEEIRKALSGFSKLGGRPVQTIIIRPSEWLVYKEKDAPFYERVSRGILLFGD